MDIQRAMEVQILQDEIAAWQEAINHATSSDARERYLIRQRQAAEKLETIRGKPPNGLPW
jgi:hypothetical protein